MSKRLRPRRKPSNPGKICNFVGRVKGLKVFVRNFSYECDFMVLKDTTSFIDHDLGSVIFGKPFVEATGLIYDREEGTITFEKDKEKIMFRMPHKMEMFKHIDFTDMNTHRIPPLVIEGDDDSSRKTYYSDSLDLGPEYKHDENETIDNETTMAEPNDYIIATQKNFVSNYNEGRMVEKCNVEIQGTFLVKIRNDAFNGNDGENAYEHINKFLEIVGPIKINGLTQDRFRLSIFPVSLAGAAYEWFTKECIGSITTWDNMLEKFILKFCHLSDHNEEETEEDDNPNEMDNVPKIFRIEGNLFDFETSFGELPGMVRVGSMTYFQDHRWYDELADGKLKNETLAFKAKIEGSWGDATPGVVKFCRWLKSCFKNFHELEYEVLSEIRDDEILIIDDDDMTKDVVLGMRFCKKYASCQRIMMKFALEDNCERIMKEE
ncbi:hypothetical protein Tco_0110864 [Tanacetum coccineum]